MAGANYMGGKRNAAKARSKDKVTQTWKGFFGRKRLEILGQRLAVGSRDVKSPLSIRNLQDVLPAMELAHARRVATTAGGAPSDTDGPCNEKVSERGITHSRPRIHKNSKVIQALDESEPMFARVQVDRILSMTNFACLPNRATTSLNCDVDHMKKNSPEDVSSASTKPYILTQDKFCVAQQTPKANYSNISPMPIDTSRTDEKTHPRTYRDCGLVSQTQLDKFHVSSPYIRDMQEYHGSDDTLLNLDSSLPYSSPRFLTLDASGPEELLGPNLIVGSSEGHFSFNAAQVDHAYRNTPSSQSNQAFCGSPNRLSISGVPSDSSTMKVTAKQTQDLPLSDSVTDPDDGPSLSIGNMTSGWVEGCNSPCSSTPSNSLCFPTRIHSPAQRPQPFPLSPQYGASDSTTAVERDWNILNDPDPWKSVAEILSLELPNRTDTEDENYRTYDRRGVGYEESNTQDRLNVALDNSQTQCCDADREKNIFVFAALPTPNTGTALAGPYRMTHPIEASKLNLCPTGHVSTLNDQGSPICREIKESGQVHAEYDWQRILLEVENECPIMAPSQEAARTSESVHHAEGRGDYSSGVFGIFSHSNEAISVFAGLEPDLQPNPLSNLTSASVTTSSGSIDFAQAGTPTPLVAAVHGPCLFYDGGDSAGSDDE